MVRLMLDSGEEKKGRCTRLPFGHMGVPFFWSRTWKRTYQLLSKTRPSDSGPKGHSNLTFFSRVPKTKSHLAMMAQTNGGFPFDVPLKPRKEGYLQTRNTPVSPLAMALNGYNIGLAWLF